MQKIARFNRQFFTMKNIFFDNRKQQSAKTL